MGQGKTRKILLSLELLIQVQQMKLSQLSKHPIHSHVLHPTIPVNYSVNNTPFSNSTNQPTSSRSRKKMRKNTKSRTQTKKWTKNQADSTNLTQVGSLAPTWASSIQCKTQCKALKSIEINQLTKVKKRSYRFHSS